MNYIKVQFIEENSLIYSINDVIFSLLIIYQILTKMHVTFKKKVSKKKKKNQRDTENN